MNQANHTDEQYQLCLHIAALETIVAYAGPSIPKEERVRIAKLKELMLKRLNEINLKVTPQELLEHIASFYETKH